MEFPDHQLPLMFDDDKINNPNPESGYESSTTDENSSASAKLDRVVGEALGLNTVRQLEQHQLEEAGVTPLPPGEKPVKKSRKQKKPSKNTVSVDVLKALDGGLKSVLENDPQMYEQVVALLKEKFGKGSEGKISEAGEGAAKKRKKSAQLSPEEKMKRQRIASLTQLGTIKTLWSDKCKLRVTMDFE